MPGHHFQLLRSSSRWKRCPISARRQRDSTPSSRGVDPYTRGEALLYTMALYLLWIYLLPGDFQLNFPVSITLHTAHHRATPLAWRRASVTLRRRNVRSTDGGSLVLTSFDTEILAKPFTARPPGPLCAQPSLRGSGDAVIFSCLDRVLVSGLFFALGIVLEILVHW